MKYSVVAERPSRLKGTASILIAFGVMAAAAPVCATEFELGEGKLISWNNTVRYSTIYRLQNPSNALLLGADPHNPGAPYADAANADDGNRNFRKGFASSRFDLVSEVAAKLGNVGGFLRGRAWYDSAYMGNGDHDNPNSNNLTFYDTDKTPRFSDGARHQYGQGGELLDAFVYGKFDLGGRPLNLKFGRHVVSWGEGLFLPGISAVQGPIDLTKANVPGVELKEIFMPVGQLSAQFQATNNLNLLGYVQYEWKPVRIDASGTYFSTGDPAGAGAQRILIPLGGPAAGNLFAGGNTFSVERQPDNEPRKHGQYGLGARLRVLELNNTEFGLYFIKYHQNIPVLELTAPVGPFSTYRLAYPEDSKATALSFSTVLGETSVAGEVSYRKDTPLQIKSLETVILGNYVQAQFSAIHLLPKLPFADSGALVGEIGYTRTVGGTKIWNNTNQFSPSACNAAECAYEWGSDKSAWGFAGQVALDYFNVLPNIDLTVPIGFKVNPSGTSRDSFGLFVKNSSSYSIGTRFTYKQGWQAELTYTSYTGDAYPKPSRGQALIDRDFLAFSIKNTF